MSTDKNTIWLAAAYDNFRTAVSQRNLALAVDVIQDTRDKGFTAEAAKMAEELANTRVEHLIVKSDPKDI